MPSVFSVLAYRPCLMLRLSYVSADTNSSDCEGRILITANAMPAKIMVGYSANSSANWNKPKGGLASFVQQRHAAIRCHFCCYCLQCRGNLCHFKNCHHSRSYYINYIVVYCITGKFSQIHYTFFHHQYFPLAVTFFYNIYIIKTSGLIWPSR